MEYNMWTFKGKEFTSEDINKAFGFVYLITDLESGRKYIGQKHFWSRKTVQKKGIKKKVKCESDWKKYASSSDELKKQDPSKLKKEILFLCISKGQMNYIETLLQMDLRVLENQEVWLNGIVNIRCHHTHHKIDKIIDNDSDKLKEIYNLHRKPITNF